MGTSFSTEDRTEFFKDQLDEAYFRIQGLEEELADKRKEIKRLERKLARYESEGIKAGVAEDIFRLWVATVGMNPNRTKFSPDRRKAITAALKLRDEADVRKIIAQLGKTPYLVYGRFKPTGSPDSRYVEITDVLGKAKHAEALLTLANAVPDLALTEEQITDWHSRLMGGERVLERIFELRGWEPEVLETLGVGFDGERLVFPVRGPAGELVGAIRYFPGERRKDVAKSLAIGIRSLFPAPETVDSDVIWLVEGEPDAVTAHQAWLPGVGVPGAGVKPGEWMERLKGKRVVICFDCDQYGRAAANRIARPLTQYAIDVRVIDLDPSRSDGYDLSDWFKAGRQRKTLEEMARVAKPVSNVQTPSLLPQQTFPSNPDDHDDLFNDFIRALEQRDCEPKEVRGGQWIARCPVHDDRVPTLHFKRGHKTPVVADCKAGCEWSAIKETLAWPARKER